MESSPVEIAERALREINISAIAQDVIARHVVAAIEAAGFKIVGREPTEAMRLAGEPVVYECFSLEPGEGLDENPAVPTWSAMFDASPLHASKGRPTP